MLLVHIISERKYIVFNEDLSLIQTNCWSSHGKGTYPQCDDDSHLVNHTLSESYNPLIAIHKQIVTMIKMLRICVTRLELLTQIECLTGEKNVMTTQLTKLKN